MAAEYILKEGNEAVMLCERGIRTFEPSYRFTLDLMAVPVLRELTHLPIVIDPSHAAGKRDAGAAAVAGRGRGGRRRDHRRGAPRAPRRRSATARRRCCAEEFAAYLRKLEAAAELAGKQFSDGVRIAVLGVGLIGGSIGLAAQRARRGRRGGGLRPRRRAARAAPRAGRDRPRRGDSVEEAVDGRASCASPARPWARCPELVRGGARRRRATTCVVTRRGLDQAGPRRAARRRPALRRRPPDRRRRDGRRGARARRPVPGRRLVPDAARAVRRAPVRAPAPLRGGRRRAARSRSTPRPTTGSWPSFSHLPHVLANVLVSQAAARLSDAGRGAAATSGPSFRDMTRVAGANTAIWTDIYRSNRDAIAEEIRGFRRELERGRARCSTARRRRAAGTTARARTGARCSRPALAGGPGARAAPHRPEPPRYRRPGGARARQGGGEHRRHGARAGVRHADRRDDALDRRRRPGRARARADRRSSASPSARE